MPKDTQNHNHKEWIESPVPIIEKSHLDILPKLPTSIHIEVNLLCRLILSGIHNNDRLWSRKSSQSCHRDNHRKGQQKNLACKSWCTRRNAPHTQRQEPKMMQSRSYPQFCRFLPGQIFCYSHWKLPCQNEARNVQIPRNLVSRYDDHWCSDNRTAASNETDSYHKQRQITSPTQFVKTCPSIVMNFGQNHEDQIGQQKDSNILWPISHFPVCIQVLLSLTRNYVFDTEIAWDQTDDNPRERYQKRVDPASVFQMGWVGSIEEPF